MVEMDLQDQPTLAALFRHDGCQSLDRKFKISRRCFMPSTQARFSGITNKRIGKNKVSRFMST